MQKEKINGEMEGKSGLSAQSGCLYRCKWTSGSILNDINELIDRSCGHCTSSWWGCV